MWKAHVGEDATIDNVGENATIDNFIELMKDRDKDCASQLRKSFDVLWIIYVFIQQFFFLS